MQRRTFLRAGAIAAASAIVPRFAHARGPALIARLRKPQDLETPLEYFDRLVTPTEVFFVRSHFGPPALDRRRALRVEGVRTVELRSDALRQLRPVTVTAVLQCAGNGRSLHVPRVPGVQWGQGAMGQASFTGVRLADLLEQAGIPPGTAHVELEGYDEPPMPTVPRYVRSIPLDRALDPTTLVAWAMNGEPLTLAHGAPFRLVVPTWAGDHWVKWLRSIRLRGEEAKGFYMQTAYKLPTRPVAPGSPVAPADMRPLTTFPVRSVIARPADGDRLPPGPCEVIGIAFSGFGPIARVEVSLDGGATWSGASLEGDPGTGRWQVFRLRFGARAGRYRAVARATDRAGNVQPREAQWNPSGYFWNGWHAVEFVVLS